MHAADVLKSSGAPRSFGQALVWLGIAALVVGISYHVTFMVGLRKERRQMKAEGLIHADSAFPASMTLMVSILLLGIGVMAVLSMTFHIGPFG